MQPISRRSALQIGGAGLILTAIGGTGLTWALSSEFEPVGGTALVEPLALRSANGELRVLLEVAEIPLTLAGRHATTLSYNGNLPGPTLYVQPGDRLSVQVVNRLSVPTNLHMHGLHVSPRGNGDNVFIMVDPGQSFDYDYQLPDDHPPGVYWYHPHHHGMVADQVFGGLYGALIVGEPESGGGPSLPVSRERVLVISDISLDGSGRVRPAATMARMMGREGDLVLVNGQVRPVLTAEPGERQRWRIVNACASRYLRLRLDGQRLQLLGVDSGHYRVPREVEEILLAPSNRADVLVVTADGSSELATLAYDRGGMMGMMGGAVGGDQDSATSLGTLEVTGTPAPSLPPVANRPASRDLRDVSIDGHRTLTFAMGMSSGMSSGMSFTIDGKEFDAARVDQIVKVGTVEEWTIENTSPMDHPVHLHVWPMQIVEQDGQPLDEPTWREVVNIPARSNAKVRIAFDRFGGRTVYHCHILDHEDNGMMGVIYAE